MSRELRYILKIKFFVFVQKKRGGVPIYYLKAHKVELFLDKRQIALPIPCPGGYTGGADSVHSAHPPLKCRTAAAWQYAVWSESAGNGPGTGNDTVKNTKEIFG